MMENQVKAPGLGDSRGWARQLQPLTDQRTASRMRGVVPAGMLSEDTWPSRKALPDPTK